MANVEGQQVPAKAHPTCGGWPNLTIQGRRPCHGNTPPHDRPRRRLRIAVFRQGRGPGPAGRKHAGSAARHRDGRLLCGVRPIRTQAAFARVLGRTAGNARWRCVRTWAHDAGGNLRSAAAPQAAGGRTGFSSRSHRGGGGRSVAGGAAAGAGGDSAFLARTAGGPGYSPSAGARGRTRDSPDSGGRRDRTLPRRLPRRVPHRDGGMASHHRQRSPAPGPCGEPDTE